MRLLSIKRTPSAHKAFLATFMLDNGRTKAVRFGTASNYALNRTKSKADRSAYIARHRVNEDWSDPTRPGTLSRYILWGESRSWKKNAGMFRRKFGV